jgi:hypothetical protein
MICLRSLLGDWRFGLVGCLATLLCLLPLLSVLAARWIGNSLRRAGRNGWQE